MFLDETRPNADAQGRVTDSQRRLRASAIGLRLPNVRCQTGAPFLARSLREKWGFCFGLPAPVDPRAKPLTKIAKKPLPNTRENSVPALLRAFAVKSPLPKVRGAMRSSKAEAQLLLRLRRWRLLRRRSLRLPRRRFRGCSSRRFRRRGSSRRSRLGRWLLLHRRFLRRLVIVHHGYLRRRNWNRRPRCLQIRPQPHNLCFLRRRQTFQPLGEPLARALKTFQIVGQRLKIVLRSKRPRFLHHAPQHVIQSIEVAVEIEGRRHIFRRGP